MDIETLKEYIISTYRPFDPDKIILFGSLAREESDDFSDIDLIIIYNTDKRFLDRLEELYLRWDMPKAVDILAYTPSEFERMLKENSFIQDAIIEGQVVYEKVI